MPGTERYARLFEVRTHTYVHLRQLWVFITRENASFASLAHSIRSILIHDFVNIIRLLTDSLALV